MSILSFLEAIVDTVLPIRGRSARTKARTLGEIPLLPMPHDILGVRITTLMEYQNPAVEDLVRSLKYDGSAYAANLAAAVLADYLREEMISSRTFSARKIILVPVPLHKSRARERGWNQIELVLRALPEEFHSGTLSYIEERVLARTRTTRPQTRLPRSERLSNVAGAFAVTDEAMVSDAHIYLIDDVTTTGATL